MTNREMDALICKHFFDWDKPPEERVPITLQSLGSVCGYRESIPPFTTDPAASKQLREKLAERWLWVLTLNDGGDFTLDLFGREGLAQIDVQHSGRGATEEAATADAALKSAGIQ